MNGDKKASLNGYKEILSQATSKVCITRATIDACSTANWHNLYTHTGDDHEVMMKPIVFISVGR